MVKHYYGGRRDRITLERGTLRSGLLVETEFDRDDQEVIVSVGKDDVNFSRSVPIRGFPLFGRPLPERIRNAILELEAYWQDRGRSRAGAEGQAKEAAHTALYAGGPVTEGRYSIRSEPPLIFRFPPDPPSV